MSIESWKAEFYPAPAKDCSPEEAVAHSLRKWEGLRKSSLAKHSTVVNFNGNVVGEDGTFWITASSCALCEHFYGDEWEEPRCPECPLAIARGGVPCDDEAEAETLSPWASWCDNNNPEPMIAALQESGLSTKAAKGEGK